MTLNVLALNLCKCISIDLAILLIWFVEGISQDMGTMCPPIYMVQMRAYKFCGNVNEYHCLPQQNGELKEVCEKPVEIPAGHYPVYSEHSDKKFLAEECSDEYYQPIAQDSNKFYVINGQGCSRMKTLCGGTGELVCNHGSTISNRLCLCNYTAGYRANAYYVNEDNKICFDKTLQDGGCFKFPCDSSNQEINPAYKCVNRCPEEYHRPFREFDCVRKVQGVPETGTKKTPSLTTVENDIDEMNMSDNNTYKIRLAVVIGCFIIVIIVIIVIGVVYFIRLRKCRARSSQTESSGENGANPPRNQESSGENGANPPRNQESSGENGANSPRNQEKTVIGRVDTNHAFFGHGVVINEVHVDQTSGGSLKEKPGQSLSAVNGEEMTPLMNAENELSKPPENWPMISSEREDPHVGLDIELQNFPENLPKSRSEEEEPLVSQADESADSDKNSSTVDQEERKPLLGSQDEVAQSDEDSTVVDQQEWEPHLDSQQNSSETSLSPPDGLDELNQASSLPECKFPQEVPSIIRRMDQLCCKKYGLRVQDVPGDGHCFYHAFKLLLDKNYPDHFRETDVDQLRKSLVKFFENLSTADSQYKEFLSDPAIGDVTAIELEDKAIETNVADASDQMELRWQQFLKRIENGEWAESLAIKGLSQMYNIPIIIVYLNQNHDDLLTEKFNPGGIDDSPDNEPVWIGNISKNGKGHHFVALLQKDKNT